MKRPLGENLTNETGGLSSSIRVLRHWPVAVSQMRHSPSYEAETMSVPSQEKMHAAYGVGVRRQDLQTLSSLHVPDTQRFVK